MSNATTFGFGLAAGLALTREGVFPLLLVLLVMAITALVVRVLGSPEVGHPATPDWDEPQLAVASVQSED